MDIQKLLTERLDYTNAEADMLKNVLENLQPPLQPLLERWANEGIDADDTLFHGYSIDRLKEGGMNFIAALLTLDWLIREPEQALAAFREGVK